MIELQRNAVNRIAVNLKNQNPLTTQIYLFQMTSRLSEEALYVIPTVISETDRTTILTIDTNSNDELNGAIILPYGEYDVEVYSQSSSTLTPNGNSFFSTSMFVELDDVLYKTYSPTINATKVYKG